MRRSFALVIALLSAAALLVGLVVAASPASAATNPGLVYVPLSTPHRVMNTGSSSPAENHKGSIAHGAGVSPTMFGVPSTASAVAVTLTAYGSSAAGALETYAFGSKRPTAAMLQFAKGQTVSDFVVVPLVSDKINIFNFGASGSTHLMVDVAGYYTKTTSSNTLALTHVLPSPIRVVDTTNGTGAPHAAVAAQGSITPIVTTAAGAPTIGTGEILASVSVINATKSGSLIAYTGSRPTESSMHFDAGRGTSSLLIVPTDSAGRITLFNNSTGSINIKVDVEGWVQAGPAEIAGSFQHLPVSRAVNGTSVAANGNLTVNLHGKGGLPLSTTSRAVFLTLHVQSATASGALSVETGGTSPAVRNVSFATGQTVSDSILVPLASNGTVTIHNGSAGKQSIFVDSYGYVVSNSLVSPATSTGRYVRNITDSDVSAMQAEGAADRAAGARLVLLEFGAQTDDGLGVQLSATFTKVSYAKVAAAVESYLAGFGTGTATVAIGTNNDGNSTTNNWTGFTDTQRGARWAQLIAGVTPPSGVTVVGANDIEPAFFSTELQAQHWETSYLAATTRGLIFNGSSDGCPTTIGATSACDFTWTLGQLYALAHNGTRIKALPQIYTPQQAEQWANIDLAGGKALVFAGVLTEHAAVPTQFTPAQGWSALYRALTSVVTSPSLPALVDLRVDS